MLISSFFVWVGNDVVVIIGLFRSNLLFLFGNWLVVGKLWFGLCIVIRFIFIGIGVVIIAWFRLGGIGVVIVIMVSMCSKLFFLEFFVSSGIGLWGWRDKALVFLFDFLFL